MIDLIFGYLLIIICLFSANLGLLLGDFKDKQVLIAILSGILTIVTVFISSFISLDLIDYFAYVFIAIALILFVLFVYYIRNSDNNLKTAILIFIMYYISIFIFSSHFNEFSLVNSLFLAFIFIIFSIGFYLLSKLLHYAKRDYPVIVGEYMCLMDILLLIFGLTFSSTLNLDYSMFSSFLILTPTYKVVYVIIGIVVLMVIGLYYNDKMR